MSDKLRAGDFMVRYTRQYGAADWRITSPVLDTHTFAVPVRASSVSLIPGNEAAPTGIAMQSYWLVLTVDDPERHPMVVRPWWIAVEQAEIMRAGVNEPGSRALTINI